MHEHIQIRLGAEKVCDAVDQRVVVLLLPVALVSVEVGGAVIPEIEDAVVPLPQNEFPRLFPEMEAAIPPRGIFGEHVRKLPAQKHGESLVPIMQRFGKKLVLPLEAFIDICFVEAGIGGNGLGRCLYKALSGNDTDGASDECLLNFSLFQNGYSYAGSAIAKISGCLRRGGKTANPPPFCRERDDLLRKRRILIAEATPL